MKTIYKFLKNLVQNPLYNIILIILTPHAGDFNHELGGIA